MPIRLQVIAGGFHVKYHALLAVPGHRAPALKVGGHHANIHALCLAGVQRSGLRAVGEGEVVGHTLIVVRHLNHQTVTHRNLRGIGCKPVIRGCLDLQRCGLPRAGRRRTAYKVESY